LTLALLLSITSSQAQSARDSTDFNLASFGKWQTVLSGAKLTIEWQPDSLSQANGDTLFVERRVWLGNGSAMASTIEKIRLIDGLTWAEDTLIIFKRPVQTVFLKEIGPCQVRIAKKFKHNYLIYYEVKTW
jgi:hypothetical protein